MGLAQPEIVTQKLVGAPNVGHCSLQSNQQLLVCPWLTLEVRDLIVQALRFCNSLDLLHCPQFSSNQAVLATTIPQHICRQGSPLVEVEDQVMRSCSLVSNALLPELYTVFSEVLYWWEV